ncbi:MAG TPA: glycogen debranching N-terminal domain-containing protein [Thermoanaerobaculia bacterium]|jgi:glycogen debranching enzyme|nr:glycogen debranching N-terminal domain-containing protein [Thermoanaerobaculia bacterium]
MRRAAPALTRVRPRPFTTHISRGRSVIATTVDGRINGNPDHGLFVHETRLLSRWKYLIDDQEPSANAFSAIRQNHWLGYFVAAAPGVTMPPRDEGSGQVPPESQCPLELRITRVIDDGLHEDIDLTNYTTESSTFVFAIELDADFADQGETRERQQHGECAIHWDASRLTFDYTARTLKRSVVLEIANASSPVDWSDGRLTFSVTLAPKERWHACVLITPIIDGAILPPPPDCYGSDAHLAPHEQAVRWFLDETTSFETPESHTMTADVTATLEQARADLASLRLFDLDENPRSWTVAAGLPLYIALFGRDTLTTGWQAGLLGPEIMTGTLHTLAKVQGTRVDDWRDEQPGKMLHEAHTGPLSMLDFNPRGRSYSSITTSGLYAFIVAELWHWTGDKNLVRPFIEPALRALQWLERYGDIDGDGFYEYQSRSPMGPRNQGWKDSPDAITYEDGTLVDPPIATCEEQAFVYVAKLHLSEMLFFLGERALSRKLYHEASELRKRFNEAFWMEDEGFYALALDAQKRPVRSITSNPGHCIAAAITDASLVERTADRLFAPDLFSGWGIRTLSTEHPRYNPYSYHLGSIWPVEHGTFALGFMRYGLHDRVEQIARAQFEAAALFEYHRLPELFGGHPRDERHPFPAIYPNANSPQAWSASPVFTLLQSMLGLYPYAPLKMLVVDPHLPEWLPEITLRDLRVGKASVTIRFRRRADGRTSYRILDQRGKLHVLRQATPWSLTTQPAERLRDALSSLIRRGA